MSRGRTLALGGLVALLALCAPAFARGALAAKAATAPPPELALPASERAAYREVAERLRRGEPAVAESLARALLARVRVETHGAATATATALDLHVKTLPAAGSAADPITLAEAQEAIALRAQTGDSTDTAFIGSLEGLARVLMLRSRSGPADSLFGRVLALREAQRPPDSAAIGNTLRLFAETRRVQHRLTDAIAFAREAVRLLPQSAAPDSVALQNAYETLGNAYAEQGALDDAATALARALVITEARGPSGDLSRSFALRDLARLAAIRNDPAAARALCERGLALQERLLGREHADLALTLTQLSSYCQEDGDLVAAMQHAERALRIRERAYGPESPGLATALIRLSNIHGALGDMTGGRRLAERALAINRNSKSTTAYDLSFALSSLGSFEIALGEGDPARRHFEEVMAIRTRTEGARTIGTLFARGRRADALLLLGRKAEAIAEYDSVVALETPLDPVQTMESNFNLGVAAYIARQRSRAEAALAASRAANDSMPGVRSPHALERQGLMARIDYARGRRVPALEGALEVERAGREQLRATARGLAGREALRFAATRASGQDLVLTLAADSVGLAPADQRRALDALIRSRDLVVDERVEERRLLALGGTGMVPAVRELSDARGRLAGLRVRQFAGDEVDSARVAAAEERRDLAERALSRQSLAFRTRLSRTTIGVDEVAAAVPADGALVSIARFERALAWREGTEAAPESVTSYVAFVLPAAGAEVRVVPLGASASLEALVNRWLALASTPPPADPAGARRAEAACTEAGAALRRRVWDPLLPALAGARRVFVVPDAALLAVDFGALPAARGRFLAESDVVVQRLGSERDLLAPDSSAAAGRGLLALGGPDFDAGDAPGPPADAHAGDGPIAMRRAASPAPNFAPLHAAAGEAQTVAEVWGRAAHDPSAGDAIRLTGTAATESAFRADAPGRRVLHLATHAVALEGARDAGAPENSRAVGALVRPSQLAANAPPPRSLESPGLAFAGANHAASVDSASVDGILSSDEIETLPLEGVEWAVLSACATGLADPHAIEGVQGLNRALRIAGVRTVILSLWAVDDASTPEWMEALYRARLERGLDTGSSVREAQRRVLAARRARRASTHPFYWGAFVATGDWR